jgi:hypothetical protein
MNHDDDRDPFDGARVPRAPAELEARVLQAATEAMESSPTLWDQLWESRPLRATWAMVTTGLIVANVAVSFQQDPSTGKVELASTSRDEIEKIRDVLGFASMEIGPRAEALVMGAGSSNEAETEPRERSHDDEVQS